MGRTGSYIAIDCATEELKDKRNVDVKKQILQMREARKDMVQNVVSSSWFIWFIIFCRESLPVFMASFLLCYVVEQQKTRCKNFSR